MDAPFLFLKDRILSGSAYMRRIQSELGEAPIVLLQ